MASADRPHPTLALSMGDPAGIGPELCLQALKDPEVLACCTPVVFADAALLRRVADACGIPEPEVVVRGGVPHGSGAEPCVIDCPCPTAGGVTPGAPQAAGGHAALLCLKAAVEAVKAGHAAALVTAPVSKEALHMAGLTHPGHTELLAELTGARDVRMLFACDELRVCLATIHVPYVTVPALLSRQGVGLTIRMAAEAAQRLGCARPRVVVCGLNPHAGEAGLFGREEMDIIFPAVEDARRRGIDIEGPIPADTAFLPERMKRTDVFVVMYHDQGLIPFKMLAFERGVNVTLGLPFVRTSPDHGTAFDIAWKGCADTGSMRESVKMAARLAASGVKP